MKLSNPVEGGGGVVPLLTVMVDGWLAYDVYGRSDKCMMGGFVSKDENSRKSEGKVSNPE